MLAYQGNRLQNDELTVVPVQNLSNFKRCGRVGLSGERFGLKEVRRSSAYWILNSPQRMHIAFAFKRTTVSAKGSLANQVMLSSAVSRQPY